MIKKVKGGYRVVSESGKNLSKVLKTKAAAEKRLAQVEYFKAKGDRSKETVGMLERAYGGKS